MLMRMPAPFILRTRILATSVRVLDECDAHHPLYVLQRHPRGLNRVNGLQCCPYAPSDNLLCAGIMDEGQIAKDVVVVIYPDGDVRYVAQSKLVGPSRDEVLAPFVKFV